MPFSGMECQERHIFVNSISSQTGDSAEKDWGERGEKVGNAGLVAPDDQGLCAANCRAEQPEEQHRCHHGNAPGKKIKGATATADSPQTIKRVRS